MTTAGTSGTSVRTRSAPLVVAGAGIAAFALLRTRDPHVAGYVACPFHAVTGLWCPLCGGLRAAADLTHGDVLASLSSNLLVAPALAVAVLAWLGWVSGRALRSGRRGTPGRAGRTAMWVVPILALAFTVARNTEWGAWLAP